MLGCFNTFASGINNAGQITGSSGSHAFLYSNGQITDLGLATGLGINNAGQITGSSDGRAYLYRDGVITNLGTLPGTTGSVGYGINDAGQIVGYSYSDIITGSTVGDAFLYSNGVLTDLGTLGGVDSRGYAINKAGQIVGQAGLANIGVRAFLDSNGVMVDLNTLIDPNLQITLLSATGINDNGQIVANSNNHAYLLTPVPEPGTWALLGAGLLLVAALARSYTR